MIKNHSSQLSRSEICTANFKAPCKWRKFRMVIEGKYGHLYKWVAAKRPQKSNVCHGKVPKVVIGMLDFVEDDFVGVISH